MKKNIPWIDVLRIVACFLVVMSHSCDPFVAQFDANRSDFLTGAFVGSFMRSCVPLFVMISGVLLLPVNVDTTTFYSKRLKRVLMPLIFWSVITPLLYAAYFSFFSSTSPNIVAENHTLSASVSKMYMFIFNFTYDTIPLWYLYMLIGLYLFMPIIGAWLNSASQKDIRIFLYIWIVSMILPYVKMVAPALGYTGGSEGMGLLGECLWNPYGTFYYFSGFLGYVVLAYYLTKYPFQWSMKRTLAVAIPTFIIGYAITSIGFIFTQKYYPGIYEYLEVVWYFTGINVFMMTFAIFIIFQKMEFKSSEKLSRIASLTFGVYLCHFIFVQMGYDLIYGALNIPAFVKIFLNAIFAFVVSLGITWILSKIKYIKTISGN